MSITVTTLKPHSYAGKRRRPGDSYQVRGRSDLAVIKALGWGFEAPPMPVAVSGAGAPAPAPSVESATKPAAKRAPRRYRTTALEAVGEADPGAPAAHGTYEHADLVARAPAEDPAEPPAASKPVAPSSSDTGDQAE